MPIYKVWKDDLGNYRPISLTLVHGKVMEQTILRAIKWHAQDNQGIRPPGFTKSTSCLTNLIIFHDKVTHSGDEQKAVDVVDLDFGKLFDTISIAFARSNCLHVDRCTLCWVKNVFGWPRPESGDLVDNLVDQASREIKDSSKSCFPLCEKSSSSAFSRLALSTACYLPAARQSPAWYSHAACNRHEHHRDARDGVSHLKGQRDDPE
ncbi:RNA-directed DNA polymerase from mobile element jockey-like protein [Pitangus sulphuratus]|nr:RNA-directed DNA polymerase from mobile element jockey-like protein [Pitangus sulphuratus]